MHYFNPKTGEMIATSTPADWMGRADAAPPSFDPAKQGCFWRGKRWEIVEAEPQTDPVPGFVTMRQARLALLQSGLLGRVNAAIAAMPGTEGEAARIEWEYAQEVRRDSALMAPLAAKLGLTGPQIDDLFALAATL